MPQNADIDISILLPTRKRPALVRRLLDSVLDTATKPDSVEAVCYIDDDDEASRDIAHPGISLTKLTGPRITMGAMHRACYEASRGRCVMLAGDDVVFRTPGWDSRVMEVFGQYPDRLVLVYGNDLIQGPNMSTAPFLSRQSCELLGGPCPAEYPTEFIDAHLMDQFLKLRYWGYDRIVYLDDVIFEHMHYVVDKAPFDETYAMRPKTDVCRELFFSLDQARVRMAKKLVAYLKENGAVKCQAGTVIK